MKSQATQRGVLPLSPTLVKAHNSSVVHATQQWKESKRVPPVLLMTGPRGIGKREMAHWIAQLLQCERAGFSEAQETSLFGGSLGLQDSDTSKNSNKGPCGSCAACERAIHGNSVDFTEIELEKDSQTLKIDQFRSIKESMGFSSFSGSYRVFLISEAERMTNQAANSILKLLEEPPPGWVFLLTCSDPSALPTTVLSRCQILRMRPLSDETLREVLFETRGDLLNDVKKLESAIRCAQGSLNAAITLLDEENWEKRIALFDFLDRPQSHLASLIDWASSEHERFRMLLDQLERILSDCIQKIQNPHSAPLDSASKVRIEKHIQNVSKKLGSEELALRFFINRIERIFSLRREMNAPLNSKVLIQDLLIPWLHSTG